MATYFRVFDGFDVLLHLRHLVLELLGRLHDLRLEPADRLFEGTRIGLQLTLSRKDENGASENETAP